MAKKPKLKIMVSSTVYGIEELLERIHAILTKFGYEVWMSHKGTLPVFSSKSTFDNCLDGVENCDLFLSIITTQYGTGRDGRGPSITHLELQKAIRLNKPRWVLAHDHVIFARTLLANMTVPDGELPAPAERNHKRGFRAWLANLQYKNTPKPSLPLTFETSEKRKSITLKKNIVISDLRVIDMYEDAIRSEMALKDRQGNWVQKFASDDEAQLYASSQFYRYQEVERFVRENFAQPDEVRRRIEKGAA